MLFLRLSSWKFYFLEFWQPCLARTTSKWMWTKRRAKDWTNGAKTEDECRDNDNGVLLVPHNAIEYHDVTGDGVPEEFLIRGRLNCSSGFSLWSGSGGSWISVIVDGVATTFLARSFFVDTTIFNIPILLLSLHGSTCGAVGVQPCIQALVWDEGEFLTPE